MFFVSLTYSSTTVNGTNSLRYCLNLSNYETYFKYKTKNPRHLSLCLRFRLTYSIVLLFEILINGGELFSVQFSNSITKTP